jgi:hypothetical protein
MHAVIMFPKTQPHMLGFLAKEKPRYERALQQRIPVELKGQLIYVHLNLVSKVELLCGLELLTGLDVVYLQCQPQTKPLYQSGVKYRLELPGLEEWLTIPVLYKRGYGDCEDLSCALCAERRIRGIDCHPDVNRHKRVWHVTTRTRLDNDEILEDPSRVLGMGR